MAEQDCAVTGMGEEDDLASLRVAEELQESNKRIAVRPCIPDLRCMPSRIRWGRNAWCMKKDATDVPNNAFSAFLPGVAPCFV